MREKDRRLMEIMQQWTPDETETFTQQLMVQRAINRETAEEWITRGRSGEFFERIDELSSQINRANADIRRLLALRALHVPHHKAWMMALEMQYAALRKYKAQRIDAARDYQRDSGVVDRWLAESGRELTPEIAAIGITQRQIEMLQKAEAFWWSHDTATAALSASQSIPGSTVVSEVVLPSRFGWWWFDKPIAVDLTGSDHGLAALLFESDDHGMHFSAYSLDEDDGPAFALGWNWPAGESWETLRQMIADGKAVAMYRSDVGREKSHETIAHISRLFLAGCAWLQQKVVVETHGNIERHRRKQLAREDGTPPVRNEVRVIQLRRRDYSGVTHQPTEGERVSHEYSCRWVVSGHWRNQFYPSTNERKLIYIMPFVKGPADKPLKTEDRRVYLVSR